MIHLENMMCDQALHCLWEKSALTMGSQNSDIIPSISLAVPPGCTPSSPGIPAKRIFVGRAGGKVKRMVGF